MVDYEPEGRGFESLQLHHFLNSSSQVCLGNFFMLCKIVMEELDFLMWLCQLENFILVFCLKFLSKSVDNNIKNLYSILLYIIGHRRTDASQRND